MNKSKNLPLYIFALFLLALGALFLVSSEKKRENIEPIQTSSEETTTPQTTNLYQMTEIQKHNSSQDCWVIIDNGVYDLTTFLEKHPAGPEAILRYCGGDASDAFRTKPDGDPHSEEANKLLENYLIGSFYILY